MGSFAVKGAHHILKICILGEGGVGKTTLTKRIITGSFDSKTKMTIGVDFHLLKTTIFDPMAPEDADDVEQIPVQAQIWDFAGEERFRFLLPRYCKGSCGGILCYDLTRFSTTNYIDEWFGIWKDNAPDDSPIFLVGTKADLLTPDQLTLAKESITDLAQKLSIPGFFVISSKTGTDVHILTNELLTNGFKFNLKLIEQKQKK
jgi:Ras-related protein Rab-11A